MRIDKISNNFCKIDENLPNVRGLTLRENCQYSSFSRLYSVRMLENTNFYWKIRNSIFIKFFLVFTKNQILPEMVVTTSSVHNGENICKKSKELSIQFLRYCFICYFVCFENACAWLITTT